MINFSILPLQPVPLLGGPRAANNYSRYIEHRQIHHRGQKTITEFTDPEQKKDPFFQRGDQALLLRGKSFVLVGAPDASQNIKTNRRPTTPSVAKLRYKRSAEKFKRNTHFPTNFNQMIDLKITGLQNLCQMMPRNRLSHMR